MSVVTVPQVKAYLDIIHNFDDGKLQMLIDGAEDEAKQYLDRDELPLRDASCPDCQSDGTLSPASDTDDLAPTVRMGIFLLVQAMYESKDAAEMESTRQVALTQLRPYRCRMGA